MKIRTADNNGKKLHSFWCPGCNEAHAVTDLWSYNNDTEKPTFSPSILVRGACAGREDGSGVCHSFVKDGKIQFLGDCTHELKNQTVDLPEFEA